MSMQENWLERNYLFAAPEFTICCFRPDLTPLKAPSIPSAVSVLQEDTSEGAQTSAPLPILADPANPLLDPPQVSWPRLGWWDASFPCNSRCTAALLSVLEP